MNINLEKIDDFQFKKISDILNNDINVKKFVTFSNNTNTYGIYLNKNLIGLFSLHLFIESNIVIHIALLEEYRNKGIGCMVINEIIKKYGIYYPYSEYFMINISYNNEKALYSFSKTDWINTNEYDELMIEEGGEIFKIYKKENPHYKKGCN